MIPSKIWVSHSLKKYQLQNSLLRHDARWRTALFKNPITPRHACPEVRLWYFIKFTVTPRREMEGCPFWKSYYTMPCLLRCEGVVFYINHYNDTTRDGGHIILITITTRREMEGILYKSLLRHDARWRGALFKKAITPRHACSDVRMWHFILIGITTRREMEGILYKSLLRHDARWMAFYINQYYDTTRDGGVPCLKKLLCHAMPAQMWGCGILY